MPIDEYLSFIELFTSHESFKLMRFEISAEVFCKFLFDLAATWCEFLDIELYIYFLQAIFL